jgi:hypothetical protein
MRKGERGRKLNFSHVFQNIKQTSSATKIYARIFTRRAVYISLILKTDYKS